MSVTVKASPLSENSPADQGELIRTWAQQIFGNTPHAREFKWEKGGSYRVMVYERQSPVSFLRIVERAGLLDDQQVRIGGVAEVMTIPEHRGKGYAGLALQEAKRVILERLQSQFGLLFCDAELALFYARHGWRTVDCPVKVEQPSGSVIWPHCTMVLTRADQELTPKSIDLCGLPW